MNVIRWVDQTLTWLRGVGVTVFVLGGVLPLVWFIVTRGFSMKPAQVVAEQFVVPPTVLACAEGVSPSAARSVSVGGQPGHHKGL